MWSGSRLVGGGGRRKRLLNEVCPSGLATTTESSTTLATRLSPCWVTFLPREGVREWQFSPSGSVGRNHSWGSVVQTLPPGLPAQPKARCRLQRVGGISGFGAGQLPPPPFIVPEPRAPVLFVHPDNLLNTAERPTPLPECVSVVARQAGISITVSTESSFSHVVCPSYSTL